LRAAQSITSVSDTPSRGQSTGTRATGDGIWSLAAVEDVVADIRESYAGMVTLAWDGQCIALP
jgi:hypothetical protein